MRHSKELVLAAAEDPLSVPVLYGKNVFNLGD
jgi:hypothetical protein